MSAALEGYAMLKVSGRGAGLDALRQGMSARFTRKARVKAMSAEHTSGRAGALPILTWK